MYSSNEEQQADCTSSILVNRKGLIEVVGIYICTYSIFNRWLHIRFI